MDESKAKAIIILLNLILIALGMIVGALTRIMTDLSSLLPNL